MPERTIILDTVTWLRFNELVTSKRQSSSAKIADVIEALKAKHTAAQRRRLKVIKMVRHQNLSPTKVAAKLDISRASVYLYLKKFDAGGMIRLLANPKSGRPKASIPPEVRQLLTEIITDYSDPVMLIDGRMDHSAPKLRWYLSISDAGDHPDWKINRWMRALKKEMGVTLKIRKIRFELTKKTGAA